MDKVTYFGVPIEELTHEELLEATRHAAKETIRLRNELAQEEIRNMNALVEIAKGHALHP